MYGLSTTQEFVKRILTMIPCTQQIIYKSEKNTALNSYAAFNSVSQAHIYVQSAILWLSLPFANIFTVESDCIESDCILFKYNIHQLQHIIYRYRLISPKIQAILASSLGTLGYSASTSKQSSIIHGGSGEFLQEMCRILYVAGKTFYIPILLLFPLDAL